MKRDTIRIAFGVDAAYVPHVAATIASLVAASPECELHFLVLCSGVAAEDRLRVAMCAPAARFDWFDVDDPALLAVKERAHISGAGYYRLALARILPRDIDRILYLDSDIVAVRDVADLWHTDMNGSAVAAVTDPGVDADEFAARWMLPRGQGAYFNAGVLLIDLAAIRARGIFDTALNFLVANQDVLPFMDQDALNYALWKQWHQLDPIWNVQRTMAIVGWSDGSSPKSEHRWPAIVHYTTEHKPWLRGTYTPYAWLYWRYLKRTPFHGQVEAAYGVDSRARLRLFARCARVWVRILRDRCRALMLPGGAR